MKRFFMIFTVLVFASVFGCSDDSTEKAATRADIISNSIISMPSCISAQSSGTRGIKANTGDPVTDVYEGIREIIGSVDQWAGKIKEIIVNIYTLTGTQAEGEWTNPEHTPGEPVRVVWGPDTVQGYEYKVELYWGLGDAQAKGFEAYLTVNEADSTAKGIITWDMSVIDDTDTTNDQAKATFIFDSTVEPRTLEVRITGLDSAGASQEPDNGWIIASVDANHVIRFSGNFYFPGNFFFESESPSDRNYVFTITGYDETGMDVNHVNQAILQLALPESSLTDTSNMWSDSSIGQIFCDKIKDVLASEWGVGVEDDAEIAVIEGWTGLDLPGEVADFTTQNVIDILEYAALHTTDGNAAEFSKRKINSIPAKIKPLFNFNHFRSNSVREKLS